MKQTLEKTSAFEENMKKSLYMMRGVVAVALIVCVAMVVRYFMKMSSYQDNANNYLSKPTNYMTKPLFAGQSIPNVSSQSIFTLMSGYQSIDESITENEGLLTSFRLPYQSFLRHIYLPSLNVWKDPFTQKIDIDLMGEAFLKKNPYTDIALINKRTDFFKSMGLDIYNKIESIKVDNIVEEGENFYIPINVKFVAPSRRAFLFLLDKLALTSDKDNIMLVNDFFYYLWSTIRQTHGDKLEALVQKALKDQKITDVVVTKDNVDAMLGYLLTHRKQGDIKKLPLLTPKIVQSAVRASSLCDESTSKEKCLFDFREKYRSIPRLAYGLGYEKAKPSDLLYFLKSIPPLLVIDDFDFEKKYDNASIGAEMQYNVSLSLKVYGKGMQADEVSEIATRLGKACFQSDEESLSLPQAMTVVDSNISKNTDPAIMDRQRSKNLLEMKTVLSGMQAGYEELTPYKKSIKLFETYRMLDDMLLCK